MTTTAPLPLTPGWNMLVVVCKECGKRSSGPKDVKPKMLAQALRRSARDSGNKARVVLSSCLGLCPRQAVAVAWASGTGNGVVAIDSVAQVDLVRRPDGLNAPP